MEQIFSQVRGFYITLRGDEFGRRGYWLFLSIKVPEGRLLIGLPVEGKYSPAVYTSGEVLEAEQVDVLARLTHALRHAP